MSKSKRQPGFGRFEFRPGVQNFPGFRGINRQNDPGALPTNQFYLLQNARIIDGEVVSRGGLSKINTNGEVGCIVGMFDNLEPLAAGVTSGFYLTTESPSSGDVVLVGQFDTAFSETFAGDPNSGLSASKLATLSSRLLLFVAGNCYEILGGTATLVFSLPSGTALDTCVVGSTLYILLNSGDEIVTWDGSAASTVSDVTGLGAATRLWTEGTDLFVGGSTLANGTSPYIIKRNGGTYDSLGALPGSFTKGVATSWGSVVYGGRLWTGWARTNVGATDNNRIISIDTTSLALTAERTPSNHVYNINYGVLGFGSLTGSLVFLHNKDGGLPSVGTYDGASWVNVAKDLNAQTEIATSSATSLAIWNSRIYVTEETVDTPVPTREPNVVRSPVGAVTGTWTADVIPASEFSGVTIPAIVV